MTCILWCLACLGTNVCPYYPLTLANDLSPRTTCSSHLFRWSTDQNWIGEKSVYLVYTSPSQSITGAGWGRNLNRTMDGNQWGMLLTCLFPQLAQPAFLHSPGPPAQGWLNLCIKYLSRNWPTDTTQTHSKEATPSFLSNSSLCPVDKS